MLLCSSKNVSPKAKYSRCCETSPLASLIYEELPKWSGLRYPTRDIYCISAPSGIDQAQYSRIESGKVEPTISSLEKIAEALEIKVVELFNEEKPIDINSYDKSIVDKLRLLDELDDIEKNSIFNIIDIAISKKRLKDMLSNALNVAM